MENQAEELQYVKIFLNRIFVDITNFICTILMSAILASVIKSLYFSSQTLSNKEYFSNYLYHYR